MPGAGKYYGTAPRATTTKSRSGTPQIVVMFDVGHVWKGGQWEPMPTTYERSVYLSLSEAAIEYTEKKLKRLGFNADFDDPQFTAESAELECREEEYQGKVREKWDIYTGPPAVEKADETTIAELNRVWKRRNPTPPTGDDVPFLTVLARVWRAFLGVRVTA